VSMRLHTIFPCLQFSMEENAARIVEVHRQRRLCPSGTLFKKNEESKHNEGAVNLNSVPCVCCVRRV